MGDRAVSIREQTRAVMRTLIARTAIDLFAKQGFDETTIDQVATVAGVSRRTLFNYFKNKEDLALSGLSAQGEVIAARFADRPTSEDVWASLYESFRFLDEIESTPEHQLRFAQFVFRNESLRSGHADKQAQWQSLLAPLIEARLPRGQHCEFAASAIAATALACLHIAMVKWVDHDGRDAIIELYARAVSSIRSP